MPTARLGCGHGESLGGPACSSRHQWRGPSRDGPRGPAGADLWDDQDRLLFLDTLAEACEKTDWQVHAWCLMSNHFHLMSETPRGNLVHGMQWLLGVYTNRFNHRHQEFGHLFQRSLQGAAGGWVRKWLFEGAVRLRESEGSPAVSFSEGPADGPRGA